MIVICHLRLICAHYIDNRLEVRKHRIDGLFNKVLILPTVGLKDSSFHMIVTLMEFLQGILDLMSHTQISNSLSNSRSEMQEIKASWLCWLNHGSPPKGGNSNISDLVSVIEAKFPNLQANALMICRNTNILLWVIHPIREQGFANSTFHYHLGSRTSYGGLIINQLWYQLKNQIRDQREVNGSHLNIFEAIIACFLNSRPIFEWHQKHKKCPNQ